MENKLLKELIVLQRIDSTNNYAMAQLHEGMASHGIAWLAMEQTAGRGQRGRQWAAEPGANILLSIIIEPSRANLTAPFELSVCFALAAQSVFNKYSKENTTVKWPNDIYWRDRKAGGILIENIFRGTGWEYAVAGIGLNINQVQFPADAGNPVSLKQITGKDSDIIVLCREFCGFLDDYFEILGEKGFEPLLKAYNEVLFCRNQKVRLKKDNIIFEAVINGVNGKGQLCTSGAIDQEFNFGELTWLL